MKFTKYKKGVEWEQHPTSFKSYKKAKALVDKKRTQVKRTTQKRLYYRINSKYNEWTVWFRME